MVEERIWAPRRLKYVKDANKGDTRVTPQSLEESYDAIRGGFA